MSSTTTAAAASASAPVAPGRAVARTVLALRILLALFFGLASALPKLLALPAAAAVFDAIGAGDWFMYATGLVELAGAVGLLLRRLAGPAATALIVFLLCAFVTQLTALHGENAGTPFLFMVPLAVVARHRRAGTAAFLRSGR
ncbi:DoxX family protein [Kitasatospora sp. NPDC059646]|uniref:DoxX family protein n=1 Tax=Kitasatospora sp. NPDC059646 TaxID=3346893 RepID=UPI00367F1094